MSILLDPRRELAQQHIADLTEKRQKIADDLNALYFALYRIEGERMADNEIIRLAESLTTCGHVSGNTKKVVVNYLLRKAGFLHAFPTEDTYLTGFSFTPKGNDLVKKSEWLNGLTSDVSRYWQGGDNKEQKFIPVPVTDHEKEQIYKRAELKVESEPEADIYRKTKKMVERTNFHNQKGIGEAISKRMLHKTDPMYAEYVKSIVVNQKGICFADDPLEVDLSMFNFVKSDYRAFDEDKNLPG